LGLAAASVVGITDKPKFILMTTAEVLTETTLYPPFKYLTWLLA